MSEPFDDNILIDHSFFHYSYVYDTESGFYYLHSRYYDPKICRFINADALASTGQGPLGYNMFAYCYNNPINFKDTTGYDAIILYDDDLPGHIGVVVEDEDGNWWHFYWGTEGGKDGIWRRIACAFAFSVKSYTWCVPYDGELELEAINASEQFSGDYEEMYYLEGDFSECVNEFQSADEKYNLYANNCSQKTLHTLSQAETEYSNMLERASRAMLPGVAASRIETYISIKEYLSEILSEIH